MNMQQMMIQAQKMQRELKKAMDELAKQEFSVNKSGAVTITMMGDGSLKGVQELSEKIEEAKAEVNERITGSRSGFGGF